MKYPLPAFRPLLSTALLFCAGCSSKQADPAPTATSAPAVTYTDAAGRSTTISTYSAYSVTAAPVTQNQSRRAVVVRAVLPNGSTLDVSYTFAGATFPAGVGTIVLNEPASIDNYGGPVSSPTHYQAAGVTLGTIASETVSPPTVSGTYTGPLVVGGGTVRLTFSKVGF